MTGLTLKKKIVIVSATLLLLFAICLITGIWGWQQEHDATKQAANAINIYNHCKDLRMLFEQSLMGPHDYLIHANEDEREIFLKDYGNILAKKDALKTLIVGQKVKHGPEFDEIFSKAEDHLLVIEEKLPNLRMKALDLLELQLPMESHRAGFYMEEMDDFVQGLVAKLKEEELVLFDLSDRAQDRSHAVHIQAFVLLLLLGVTAVFAGIILSYYLIRNITGPVDSLIQATRSIRGGDLTVRANVETHDEISELAGSFNEMVSELADAQEQIAAVLQGSGDAMRVIDHDSNILQINKQMEHMTGLSTEDAVGKKCYEVFPGELCHTNNCTLKLIARGEEWNKLESRRRTRDGKKLHVELVATPFKKGGKTIGAIESFRDVTNRKIAEEQLQSIHMEMAVGLSEVFEALKRISSGDPTVKIPETSDIELIAKLKHSVNLTAKNLAEIVDLSHEFAMGLAEHFDALHRVSSGDLTARVSGLSHVELLESLKRVTNEMIESVSREMAERGQAEAALQAAHRGLEIRVKERTAELTDANLLLKEEISERRQVEEALRKSKEEYKILVDSSLTGIFIHQDQKYVFVTDRFAEMHGYKPEELLGKDPFSLIYPDDRETLREIASRRLRGEEVPQQYEVRRIRRDGTIIWCEMMATVIEYEGKPAIMGNMINITKRKRVEKALRKSESELRFLSSQLLTAQERERKRLSIELHDELGQALMVLKLKVRAVERALGPDQADLKKDCNETMSYITEVSETVRRLSRDLSPSILEDLGLSAAIWWLVEASTQRFHIENSVDPAELDSLFSQEGQITVYRIFQECLTNIARHARATHVSIEIAKEDGQVVFRVEDNGEGFDVKKVLRKPPSKKGVGLSAMYERTRMLGGSLDMWSKQGAGTRVTFRIPVQERGNQQ
jgi:PAS domain S-box-containing protein